ncbi:uncharacterized protein Dwil_GK14933 [Drosophila willistoni]|uniref:Uncharacterized protein n=1 Tax=Drosophila willistoni TaxID=7260 RepID=B4MW75_DROWI|nr:uncharacterized protein Dwil_GK14933 [Drosophila willistoni]
MLLQFSYMIMALSWLELGQTMPEQKIRTARDTRNIPTSMFKPIGQSSNVEQNETSTAQEDYSETFQQRSTGEAHPVLGDTSDETSFNYHNTAPPYRSNQGEYPQNLPTDLREIAEHFRRTSGASINPSNGAFSPIYRVIGPYSDSGGNGNVVYTQTFRSSDPFVTQSGFPRSHISSGPTPNGNGLYTIYSSGPRNTGNFGPSGQINSGSMPLMSRPFGFGGSPRSPHGDSSNNFHRSESFSYSSDGFSPPQIEQHVYDSRQGFGSTLRNF